jgi:hypothetical protein
MIAFLSDMSNGARTKNVVETTLCGYDLVVSE